MEEESSPLENLERVNSKLRDRLISALCHIGGIFASIPLIGVAVPFVLWQVFKGESAFVDANGKEAFNFQMTLLLIRIPSYVLFIVGIGVIMIAVVELASILFSIIAAARAIRGLEYQYPMRYRFIK
jgi:uncharacterized Tic20 family protein